MNIKFFVLAAAVYSACSLDASFPKEIQRNILGKNPVARQAAAKKALALYGNSPLRLATYTGMTVEQLEDIASGKVIMPEALSTVAGDSHGIAHVPALAPPIVAAVRAVATALRRENETSEKLPPPVLIEAPVNSSKQEPIGVVPQESDKKFVILTASYNNISFYKKNLDSVFKQTYKNWELIYMDDVSSDGTGDAVQEYIKTRGFQNKVRFVANEQKAYCLGNYYREIHKLDDDVIIVTLDGDDAFADEYVLEYLNRIYQDPDVWCTYGNFAQDPPNGSTFRLQPFPEHIINKNEFRNFSWNIHHLRSFYAALFKNIKKEDLMYEGELLKTVEDVAFMLPIIEQCGKHHRFIDKVLYLYNTRNPLQTQNAWKKQLREAIMAHIYSKPKYEPLQTPPYRKKAAKEEVPPEMKRDTPKKVTTVAATRVRPAKHEKRTDVTIVGYHRFANGLGRIPIGFMEFLKGDLTLNFVNTRPDVSSFQDIPEKVQSIIRENKHAPSNVAILCDTLSRPGHHPYRKVPDSTIKLAYSMVESTKIPDEWVSILNEQFDGVVVPDPFLVDVYKNSGVKIPIFMVPLGVYMDEFLAEPLRKKPEKVFVFGTSCALSKNKNCELLVEAFAREFGNYDKVKLKIHSPWEGTARDLREKIATLGVHNIELSVKSLSWKQYIKMMKEIDCYVQVSKGEGFSITPREALALRIPCILSNNTAQKTICESGHVIPVRSDMLEKHAGEFYGVSCGYSFNCKVEDVQKAMRDAYRNYDKHLAKARRGRKWVKRYHYKNLKPLYRSLFKPKKVVLGSKDSVTPDVLTTTSKSLYKKYRTFIKG